MKNKLKQIFIIFMKHAPVFHLLTVAALLIIIFIEVHWSVALLMAWVCYSLSTFATSVNRFKSDFSNRIKAVRREFKDMIVEARDSILEKLEEDPTQFMDDIQGSTTIDLTQSSEDTRPACSKCLANPQPGDVIYKQGNCKIHD